ncbi:sodium/potassium-transporting ATPase subunit beta-1-like [Amphiura filiformis]|uniref:sodium/potassium-transporting ATPase subunit beta-1-like n=1 Tax=Amphiura filiformis TaxID=82378 RepID=UPI003B20E0C4
MGYKELEDEDLTFMEKVQNNWNGFRKFMWNPEDRTVMGRGKKSWAKIGLFYFVLYSLLAGFWAVMLTIFLQTVSYDSPKWTAYVSTPALHSIIIPNDQLRLTWQPSDEDSVKRITKPLNKLYEDLEKIDDTDLVDCTNLPVGSIDDGQRFCKFSVEMLGECNNPPYFGWDTLKPCIFIRLNRVFGWTPENYETLEDVPDRIKNVYMDNNIAVNCFPRRESDSANSNVNFTMPFPNAGIPFGFFPYVLGAYQMDQRDRLFQPVVAVQISLNRIEEINIECQAYTGNITPRQGLFDTDQESRTRFYLDPRE